MPSITANGRPKLAVSKPKVLARESRSEPQQENLPKAPEPLTHPDDEVHCLRQVEFYFSDCNLPFDEFLWKHHSKPGADGWVPLEVISNFNRMRRFFDKYGMHWVIYVLRKSARLLEVDAKRRVVRRKPALPAHAISGWARSIYVKGFGRGAEFKGTKTDILDFFAEFAYVNVVDLRREKAEPHEFKGSVFVEFADVLEAQAFLALESPPRWKGAKLVTMSKQVYCVKKCFEKNLPKTYHGMPNMTDCDRYLRRNKFDAFKPEPRPAAPPPLGKYDISEAYMRYKGTDVRVWRPGEGLPAGQKFQGDLSKWTYVKDVPLVPGATLEMCCANDIARYVALIKKDIDYVTREKVFVAYVSKIPRHKPKRAHIFFQRPVSDATLIRIKHRLPRLGKSNIIWSRVDPDKEHELQLQDANRLARRALGGLKKSNKPMEAWPRTWQMEDGKLFLVIKGVAPKSLSWSIAAPSNKRAHDATDAGAPAAKRLKLELPQFAIAPYTPLFSLRPYGSFDVLKRAREADLELPPSKKPKLEPVTESWPRIVATFDDILKTPVPSVKSGNARLSDRRLEDYFSSLGDFKLLPGSTRKRERFDDDETPGAGPSMKKVKTEPAP